MFSPLEHLVSVGVSPVPLGVPTSLYIAALSRKRPVIMPSVYDFRHVELDKVGRGKRLVYRSRN